MTSHSSKPYSIPCRKLAIWPEIRVCWLICAPIPMQSSPVWRRLRRRAPVSWRKCARPARPASSWPLNTHHYRLLTREEYARFGVAFDRQVLDVLGDGAWFNVLHLHGLDVMFDLLADYPVQAINWHDRETSPTLAEAMAQTPRALIGGLRQWETVVRGTPADVRTEAEDAIQQTGGRRLIVGTGCVTPIVAPMGNLRAARESVDNRA